METNPPARRKPYRLPRLEDPREAPFRTWVQIVRTFYRMQRRVENVLEQNSLTLAQFDVLATLNTGEGITQQELAERLLVTKGNVCTLLDRMEKIGLVERRPDPVDRRANRIYVTPDGRKNLAAVFPAHQSQIKQSLRALSLDEIKTLRDLMERLDDNLDAA